MDKYTELKELILRGYDMVKTFMPDYNYWDKAGEVPEKDAYDFGMYNILNRLKEKIEELDKMDEEESN